VRENHPEGYYGLPMLKRPLWGWEIAAYFFTEGISSGAFILGAMADLSGNGVHRPLARHARSLAFAALLPCPPLLIADLGRPDRFHHMLRVFKPQSPMNLGAWTLPAFAAPVSLLALAPLIGLRRLPERAIHLAGLPFALIMLAYPGVLLTNTSIPLWSQCPWLGALLGASSVSSAAGALSIAAALDRQVGPATRAALHNVKRAAQIAESAALVGYIAATGSAVQPLRRGRYSNLFRNGAILAGIALPALLSVVQRKPSRKTAIASGLLSIAGAFALKWSIVHAGRESAADPAAYRDATRP
jgi:formate-dependent nitrite reductase membrane component NrfD